MRLHYKTEGALELDCYDHNSSPVGVVWRQGSNNATIRQNGQNIHISKTQLKELCDNAELILKDLV